MDSMMDAAADTASAAAEAGTAMAGAAGAMAGAAANAFASAVGAGGNWPGGFQVTVPTRMNLDTLAVEATPQATVGLTLLPIIAFVCMCLSPVLVILLAVNRKGLAVTAKQLFTRATGILPLVIIIFCAFLNMCNWILVPTAFVHAFYTSLAMLMSLQFQMARDRPASNRKTIWEISVLSAQVMALHFNVGGGAGLSFLFGGGTQTALLAIWGPVDCAAMMETPFAAIGAWCTDGWYAVMILMSTAIIFLQLACVLVYVNASAMLDSDAVTPMTVPEAEKSTVLNESTCSTRATEPGHP